jgi:chromosome segregation ATPase
VVEDKILKAIQDLRKDMNLKFDSQGNQLKENTQILKSLEHLAQVNKAEHDKLSFNISEIQGEIKSKQTDLASANHWIAKLKSVK